MAKPHPVDPLQARLIELTGVLIERSASLRDYGSTPGNAWLAKGELQTITLLLGEIEALLEEIKEFDSPSD